MDQTKNDLPKQRTFRFDKCSGDPVGIYIPQKESNSSDMVSVEIQEKGNTNRKKRKFITVENTNFLLRDTCVFKSYDPTTDIYTCGCSIQKKGKSAWRNHLRKRTKVARRLNRVDDFQKQLLQPCFSLQDCPKTTKTILLPKKGSESKEC